MKDNTYVEHSESTIKSLQKIKTFLEEQGFKLPKDFDKNIVEAAKKFNGSRLPQISAIENILKCCEYWKRYCINDEEYNKLVCAECYNMARIQCSVISTHVDIKSYIGNFCKVHEELLPECTTTVASVARCSLFEGMGAAEKSFSPLH